MNPPEILAALRSLMARERLPLVLGKIVASDFPELAYAPLARYVEHLLAGSKPETAAEEVFRAVARDVCRIETFPQVFTGEGFVDFVLPEVNGSAVLVELKPPFVYPGADRITPRLHKPKSYLDQVKKYLQRFEYVVLTDLRTAWLYSAREVFVSETYFAELPFADLLQRQVEQLSLLDVVRRAEDDVEKPDLDRQFFADLREWFGAFSNVQFREGFDRAESVILLINKLIFAKTLEDHGLINYRWVQDDYERLLDRWETKGPHRVIKAFLASFEDFFDEYYDTELFAHRIWDRLETSERNLTLFAQKLEAILGVGKWDKVFARGLVHYNYRTINEDIFGKSYEMFLAANRKDEGIYYTPATITVPMADSLVASLFSPLVDEICAAVGKETCEFVTARSAMARLVRLHVTDTASGSGGFLIKVLRAIWAQYERIARALAWLDRMNLTGDLFEFPPNVRDAEQFRKDYRLLSTQRRQLVASVLLRHIYALDKDAGALEVAKTNVWKEAVKLTPGDYNFRRLPGEAQKILPNLELNFVCADSLVDLPLGRQTAWLAEYHHHELARLSALRESYITDPSVHAPLEEALALRENLRAGLREQFQLGPLPEPPSCLPLMFFPCWFEADGTLRGNGGFEGIIGNPPWEAVKPVRKEFAKINKYSMSVVDFDALFAKKLEEDSDFNARWVAYQAYYEGYKRFLTERFVHQGTGDWNLFKLFIEADLDLLRNGGRLSLLVPSAIQTDEGCGDLRKLLILANTFEEITSFENKGYQDMSSGVPKRKQIFPDVHPQFKFGFFKVRKTTPPETDYVFDGRFYLHDPAQIVDPPIQYGVEMMRRFSPQNFSMMEFRLVADYMLCTKLRRDHKLLSETACVFRRELHPKDDVRFFHKRTTKKLASGEYPIFEGKMISQYRLDNAPNAFFAIAGETRNELRRKELSRLVDFVRESGLHVICGIPLPNRRSEWAPIIESIFD